MSNSEYGAEANDPINIFLKGLSEKNLKDESIQQSQEQDRGINTQPEGNIPQSNTQQVQAETVKEVIPQSIPQVDINQLTPEQQLEVFKRLTNLEVNDINSVKNITEIVNRVPEYEKIAQVYPKLIEELKKKQDIMGYFPDESTFKAVQLAKNENFKGKETVLMNLFNSDINQMGDMEIIAMGASIEKSPKITNPMRSAIKQIGLDPDEVLTNYDELSQDDKDDIAALADDYRRKLSQLKGSVQVPNYTSDIEKELIENETRMKDDFRKRVEALNPISMNIVNEIKEMKVTDDFTFKIDMTPEDRKGYADFFTDAVMSGDFDISTDEGKNELYDALMTEIWVDNRQKILKAYETHLRNSIEAEYRARYDNAKPLENREQMPTLSGEKVNPMVSEISQMIRERI